MAGLGKAYSELLAYLSEMFKHQKMHFILFSLSVSSDGQGSHETTDQLFFLVKEITGFKNNNNPLSE